MSQNAHDWLGKPVTVETPLMPIFVDVNNPTIEERVRIVIREELQVFHQQLLSELANVLRMSLGEERV